MHHAGVAIHLQKIRHAPGSRNRDPCQVIAREVNEHGVLGQFFSIGAHVQLIADI